MQEQGAYRKWACCSCQLWGCSERALDRVIAMVWGVNCRQTSIAMVMLAMVHHNCGKFCRENPMYRIRASQCWDVRFLAERSFRGFLFWAAGFFADFVAGFVLLIFVEKVPRKILQENPRQNPPKFIQQKSPTHFCRGAGQNIEMFKSTKELFYRTTAAASCSFLSNAFIIAAAVFLAVALRIQLQNLIALLGDPNHLKQRG